MTWAEFQLDPAILNGLAPVDGPKISLTTQLHDAAKRRVEMLLIASFGADVVGTSRTNFFNAMTGIVDFTSFFHDMLAWSVLSLYFENIAVGEYHLDKAKKAKENLYEAALAFVRYAPDVMSEDTVAQPLIDRPVTWAL